MFILLIKFKSALLNDEVRAIMRQRADQFRALPGLIQKYYTQEASTGEWCGVYLWETPEALSSFRESELARSIATTYKVIGSPRVEILDVHLTLRENV